MIEIEMRMSESDFPIIVVSKDRKKADILGGTVYSSKMENNCEIFSETLDA